MSTTVKSLTVTYNSLNEQNTFTNGDWVSGQVSVEVVKDCQLQSLIIKFKGKAEVLWSERHGQTTVVYHSKEKYFSFKQDLTQGKEVIAPGRHVYPFTFQIPFQNMPSTFQGSVGKVVYLLEAKLSRSMRIDKKDSTKINFVSKTDLSGAPEIMTPQHESKDKKMKFFNSGTVAMDVNLEKTGFFQGEGLKVLAYIQNNSSREIKPKYCVYRKHSFFANGKRRVDTKDLLKEVGDPIPPSASENVTRVITIPHDMEPSIYNCHIIKAEYRLRVYLDVKYAFDPEIKFDIIIMPGYQVPALAPPPPASAAAAFGFEPFGNTNPPAWGFPPAPAPAPAPVPAPAPQAFGPPPSYGEHGMYPPLTDFGNRYQ